MRSVSFEYIYLDSRIVHDPLYNARYSLNHPRHHLAATLRAWLPGSCDVCLSGSCKVRNDGTSYGLMDLSMRKSVSGIALFLNATNLFNTPYQEVIGVPQPGRWIWGGVEAKLM